MMDVLSGLFLGLGSAVLVSTAWVILRMPTFFTRLHAASVNETLGPGLILLGLALHADAGFEVVVKLGLVFMFLVLTGPVAGHALAKAALDNGVLPGRLRRMQEEEEASSRT